ncbi:MAG: hypothetical protein KDB62_10355, partial [Solirubrobacterales bacterium]|nr:hypothetical protein [Solirubrobacterales bacterium]
MSALSLVGFDQAYAMGRAGAAGADHLILTSQRADPGDPLDRLVPGLLEGAWSAGAATPRVEPDRRAAIELAISEAQPDDVVLVLDRGEIGGDLFDPDGRPRPLDDRDEVRAAIERLGR